MTDDPWVRPGIDHPEPRWGHRAGLQVGLPPLPGPRGLIRIYTPYLGHRPDRLINFIAIEPIPAGADRRGYSELEASALDAAPGKRLTSTDDPERAGDPERPVPGVVATDGGRSRLTVHVVCERFDNGADVHVRVTFHEDRPHEVTLAAYRRPESVQLSNLVLSATMGNFARLRHLHLRDRVVTPAELWPGFTGDGFTGHARFGLDELDREDGAAVVTATPDEPDPVAAAYVEGTHDHWRYEGRRAAQSWLADDPEPGLQAVVNGRRTYWASTSPIPGGVAYENFELLRPFRPAQEYRFRVLQMRS